MKSEVRGQKKSEIRWVCLLIAVLCPLTSVSAADHFIRAGASGDGSGSDWTNAYSTLIGGSSYVRGDTYYIADGTYPGTYFVTPESGTDRITIKKATAADHGTSTGWSDAYGDGVALFSNNIIFTTGYWTFDGVTGGGPGSWMSGHGFKVQRLTPGAAVLTTYSPSQAISGIIWKHIEIEGDHGDGGGSGNPNDAIGLWKGSNITISHCYLHDVGRTLLMNAADFVTVEYCYFGKFESTDAQHAEVMSAWDFAGDGSSPHDITFRYCLFTWFVGTGGLIMDGSNLSVYGCVFHQTNSTSGGNGAFGTWGQGVLTGIKVYNNTFINISMPIGGEFNANDNGEFKNNLIYNPSSNNSMGYIAGYLTHTHNHYINVVNEPSESNKTSGSGNPFVNIGSLDYTLTAQTTAGATLASPYNVDPLGNTRSNWTRGAYEFGGTAPTPTPTPTPTPPMAIVTTAAVNFGAVREDTSPADIAFTVTSSGSNFEGDASGLSTPFSFVGATSFTTPATLTVRYRPTSGANDNQIITVSGGGDATLHALGICYPLMPGLTFAANAGVITMPFVDNVGAVSQTVDTQNSPDGSNPVPRGGRVSYGITIPTAGEYRVDAEVDAPDPGHNSFFINIGGEPSDPDKIWDVTQLTDGLELRSANWRGTGTFDNPQYIPKVFTLSQGVHELVIRGREPDTILGGDITIVPLLQVASAPIFSPDGGIYTTSQDVTLSTTTAGATIKYTRDGQSFGPHNPIPEAETYSTPIPVNYSTTIRAITEKAGMSDSPQATSNPYEIKVATPTFSPVPGTYNGDVTVTINCATPDVTKRYTVDGSPPASSASSMVYGTPFILNSDTTVKTMAEKNGLTMSAVATGVYTITTPSPTPTPTPTATPTPTPTPTITPTVTPPPLLPLRARIVR